MTGGPTYFLQKSGRSREASIGQGFPAPAHIIHEEAIIARMKSADFWRVLGTAKWSGGVATRALGSVALDIIFLARQYAQTRRLSRFMIIARLFGQIFRFEYEQRDRVFQGSTEPKNEN